MEPLTAAFALLLIPLVSAGLIACFFRRQGGIASALSVGAALGIAGVSFWLIFAGPASFTASAEWLTFGEFSVSLGFLVDDLAKLMLFVVAFVGLLIHLFSLGYMKGDPNVARFFGGLSLFMFSMIGLTLADDLIMLFIFWELVGLSSFLLINFYFHKPAAAAASKKAFIVNRIGDFGFLIGIIWAYWSFGSINLHEIGVRIGAAPELVQTGIALLLFCGAVGKSGQIPLHVWLPDAMEGPTPVSALIHAATMVAAGIYLLSRVSVVMSVEALTVIAWVGIATALYAGFCAIAQRDIKKILAYSTISQLGFMVAGFGLGSRWALQVDGPGALGVVNAGVAVAMFHLTTHAFFKALLFLGAGSIIHASHHEQDIFRLGGLAKKMPVTFITFTLGFLALIGMPFFSGFFSKDAILYMALEASKPAFVLLSIGALLTALYMTRLWKIVFFGQPRSEGAKHAHENGLIMTVPLMLLAVLAVIGGYTVFYPQNLGGVIAKVPHAEDAVHWLIVGVSVAAVVLGAGFAWLFYRAAPEDRLAKQSPGLFALLASRLYIDELYLWYVDRVQQRFAMLLSYLEMVFISGLAVRGTAGLAGLLGFGAKALHVGSLHSYVYWFLLGLVLFAAVAFGYAF
jgi:NADH-quinone oxidoreductase subunit L